MSNQSDVPGIPEDLQIINDHAVNLLQEGVTSIMLHPGTVAHLIKRIADLQAKLDEKEEALRLACGDAWPDNPHWPKLYSQRAASNISVRKQKEALDGK